MFRTAEGLGVGSPLAAFDTVYGRGEAIAEEGNSVRYWPIEGGGHFFVDVPGGCYDLAARRWVVDRACRATGISFIGFARPAGIYALRLRPRTGNSGDAPKRSTA